MAEDEPSLNTPLDGVGARLVIVVRILFCQKCFGTDIFLIFDFLFHFFGDKSVDTLTDLGAEEHTVEAFDPITLCKEVKHMNMALMTLDGSVKGAMLKFEHVDSLHEQL